MNNINLLSIFFENLTFIGARTIADLVFFFSIVVIIKLKQGFKIEKKGGYFFIIILTIFLFNFGLGFQNVSPHINEEMFSRLTWLIQDRGITEFVPLGDYYRNTLIYLRYLLIPIYFSLGYMMAKKNGRDVIIRHLFNWLIVAVIINLAVGLYMQDDRLKGFFDNTATMASLALMTLLISFFTRNNINIIMAMIFCGMVIVLSKTVSAYIGLLGVIVFYLLKIKRPHKISILLTIIISLVVSTVGLVPGVQELIAKYFYTGSLLNRLATWSVLMNYLLSDGAILGLGAFPVFSDNIFVWLVSGFGLFSSVIYLYFLHLGNKSYASSVFITMIMWQGLLFPGFIMPYMLITTFMILGILSYNKEN